MALTSVPTRSELLPRWLARWQERSWLGSRTVALLGALVFPASALAQAGADPTLSPPLTAVQAAASALASPPPPTGLSPITAGGATPIPAISRLPAEMSVQARAGTIELLAKDPASGQLSVVLRLPLPGAIFDTLCIGGYLYVARGAAEVVVLDVHDPMQTHQVASLPSIGTVHSLWGGTGSLMLGRLDGTAVLFDISDPLHPRYQSVIAVATTPAAPAGAVAQQVDEEQPQLRPIKEADQYRPEEAQHRMAVAVRPYMFFANGSRRPTSFGGMLDFSYQYAKTRGLWWGIEVSPMVFSSYTGSSLPAVDSRVWFGAAGRYFAMAGAMGSGITSDQAFFQLGVLTRFGRLNGVHSTLRLMWSVLLPLPYPVSGEFSLEGPISQRLGLRYNFTGDSALSGFHTTLGLQFFVGGDHRWRTIVLIPGVGFSYMRTNAGAGSPDVHHPGVIFSFTVEPRW